MSLKLKSLFFRYNFLQKTLVSRFTWGKSFLNLRNLKLKMLLNYSLVAECNFKAHFLNPVHVACYYIILDWSFLNVFWGHFCTLIVFHDLPAVIILFSYHFVKKWLTFWEPEAFFPSRIFRAIFRGGYCS